MRVHSRTGLELNHCSSSASPQGTDNLLAAMLDSTPDLIAAVDTNLRYTALNAAYARECKAIFGVEVSVGTDLAGMLAALPDDQRAALTLVRRALEGETCIVTETFGDPSLSRRCYELRFSPIRQADGRIIGAMQVGRDITERARREANRAFLAELGEVFARLSSPIEIMQTIGPKIGAYLKVKTCNFADVDERQGTMTVSYGWSEADSPDLHRSFAIKDYLAEEFRRASRAGDTIVMRDTQNDPRIDAKSYAALDIHAFLAVPFRFSNEWKYLLSVTDSLPRDWLPEEIELFQELANRIFPRIERARAAEALRESEAHFKTLFETMGEGFGLHQIICDEAGKPYDILHLMANPAYERHTGRKVEEVIGKTVRELYPDVDPYWIEAYGKVALTGEPARIEGKFGPLGRWFEVRVYQTEPGRFALLFYDITERKQVEDELKALTATLERRVAERTAELTAVNKELEGFTFATSHDLRGPLGRINSFSALLEKQYRDRLEGSGLIYLDFIRQNATRLVLLVDDLLSHARVAQLNLELQGIDIGHAAAAIVQEKAADIQESGAEVRVSLPSAQVLADPSAFSQALSNLVENALKYSSRVAAPRVEIGGEPRGDHFRLWVRDNGIGFNMEYHDKIFDMFQRLHTYNDYPGSGVGLALVKRAVERMGGKVWAESQPGQGSTFFLELKSA